MPNFLTNKVGPFPTWTWIGLGAGLVAFARYRQSKAAAAAAANTIQGGELSPEYAPGYAGQGALSGPPPISAVSQVAQTSSGSGAANAPVYNPGDPQQRIQATIAANGGTVPPFLPRVL